MLAGADSIDDMALLRHGGVGRLFRGVYAPSTLGCFLREFRFGHVRQLDAVAARVTANLAGAVALGAGTACRDGMAGSSLLSVRGTKPARRMRRGPDHAPAGRQ
jgi:hypothetical protein